MLGFSLGCSSNRGENVVDDIDDAIDVYSTVAKHSVEEVIGE
jgi:hypothetical protein